MDRGYIPLWRKSIDSQVFQNEGLWKVWCWCLIKANCRAKKWEVFKTGKGPIEIQIKEGQFIFGRNKAAKELNMRPDTVWYRMLKLKKMQNITIQSNNQFSVITICNWGDYKTSKYISSTTNSTSIQQAFNKHSTQLKKVKNVKKEKNKDIELPAWLNKKLWNEFLKMRIKIKKPATEFAQTKLINKLANFREEGYDYKLILENSIINNWQGLFAPREEEGFTKPKSTLTKEEMAAYWARKGQKTNAS